MNYGIITYGNAYAGPTAPAAAPAPDERSPGLFRLGTSNTVTPTGLGVLAGMALSALLVAAYRTTR